MTALCQRDGVEQLRVRVKAWRVPNEDGAARPWVDPAVWAADVARFKLVSGRLYDMHLAARMDAPATWPRSGELIR